MVRIHLDTDIGSDIDDLCALAMVLGWPGAELTGVSTAAEDGGRRAGYVHRALTLAGRTGIPVAAGIDMASNLFRFAPGYPPDQEYWGRPVEPRPGPADAAIEMLRQAVESGAAVVALGPWTNLAELERRHPGILESATLFLMGGSVPQATRDGFPRWGPEWDYNINLDPEGAALVLERSRPTIIPIGATAQTWVGRATLPVLRRSGPLGELIATQAEAYGRDNRVEEQFGRSFSGLPIDILNFLHDPLACAVALGWDGISVETLPLAWGMRDGRFCQWVDPAGRPTRVVVQADGAALEEEWLRAVERAGKAGPRPPA